MQSYFYCWTEDQNTAQHWLLVGFHYSFSHVFLLLFLKRTTSMSVCTHIHMYTVHTHTRKDRYICIFSMSYTRKTGKKLKKKLLTLYYIFHRCISLSWNTLKFSYTYFCAKNVVIMPHSSYRDDGKKSKCFISILCRN